MVETEELDVLILLEMVQVYIMAVVEVEALSVDLLGHLELVGLVVVETEFLPEVREIMEQLIPAEGLGEIVQLEALELLLLAI